MHYFTPITSKIFWGGGTAPSPDPIPLGEYGAFDGVRGLRRLRRRSPRRPGLGKCKGGNPSYNQ